ncbi:MAG: putative succinyl-diaminopimelate desuccinylase [Chloroflexi bacterium ADurb.Bin120]|jgi:putative selenium metabolism hydrolase|uniref:Putative hydrolase n=1 Tax=Candidatus Brevifilum fermentans TaxID=1986204 RepID=A0A1Y6K159_9CHLR|nr:YgeY family selenium metabolism-linked hydrolase [Brevefilum fermentans]OQB87985.1 MAG: putative succinyl-diaminopimelate desuccinylase [Chloroflexi bacterium ADurb.Bin120]SMX53422.1 putative hydrolase [Brevefilum fermentans]HOM67541.1 YgeY family selenium metabolism-linked hydrolase [Brevefilum fermentans]
MNNESIIKEIQSKVEEQREEIIQFLRDIVAIPSVENQIGPVGERIAEEMNKLKFDEVRFDKMGNIIGRIGDGERIIVFDSHIDTVGIGDPESWEWDPFIGKVEDGVLYARGACDEKGSTPGMVYGMAIARDMGLLEGWTAYYFGNMEEWCDGISPNTFVEVDPAVKPDYVIIGEPTKMQVYRGHKGRIELKMTAKGRSAHAASNHLGINAIYLLLPVIAGIRDLEPELGDHDFLGHGKITVSDMEVKTPSINAVPDEAVIYIDRRLTFGETKEEAFAQIQALIPEESRDLITLEELFYDEPSYTGFVFEVDKYFPAWVLDEDHHLVQAGLEAMQKIGLPDLPAGKWNFSTNGIYWAGKAGIPSIGFAPGDEETAHTNVDSVNLNDVVKATEFYALISHLIKERSQ